ncbi:MAG: flavodoxin family protein [Actinomycetia bacterium]|nr:flavodoxin family protein [Actinomycetes bacterium]
MTVLLINGSVHERGSTATALAEVARGIADAGQMSQTVWIGAEAVRPCIACGGCRKSQRCAFGDEDGVNRLIELILAADGVVFGSPVYYAGMNGALKCLLDRIFFAGSAGFALKPAACLVVARRGGTTSALEQLQKYPNIAQMPIVGSFYWPMLHGRRPEEVQQDAEGMQIAWQLGANMAWLIRCIQAGLASGLQPLVCQSRTMTNFIR